MSFTDTITRILTTTRLRGGDDSAPMNVPLIELEQNCNWLKGEAARLDANQKILGERVHSPATRIAAAGTGWQTAASARLYLTGLNQAAHYLAVEVVVVPRGDISAAVRAECFFQARAVDNPNYVQHHTRYTPGNIEVRTLNELPGGIQWGRVQVRWMGGGTRDLFVSWRVLAQFYADASGALVARETASFPNLQGF